MSDRIFLTGATGFVGSHVLRELLAAGYEVRALVRTPSRAVDGAQAVPGDLRRPGELVRAMDGCKYVVHCAALYSFAARDRAEIAAVNVAGTAGLMSAAATAGVERVVLTSSSGTIDHAFSHYHASKVAQEQAAFAGRVPVVAVLPTAPIGPGDWKPTPTGRLVLDFARGKIGVRAPGSGGMNLVAVEDVARAHVAALQRGQIGERYVVGGEDLTLDEVWDMLANVTGRASPRLRLPYGLILAVAYADEVRCRVQPRATPVVPLEGVRLSRERMYADSSKARRDLGYQPGSVRDALVRAVEWYRANGYIDR